MFCYIKMKLSMPGCKIGVLICMKISQQQVSQLPSNLGQRFVWFIEDSYIWKQLWPILHKRYLFRAASHLILTADMAQTSHCPAFQLYKILGSICRCMHHSMPIFITAFTFLQFILLVRLLKVVLNRKYFKLCICTWKFFSPILKLPTSFCYLSHSLRTARFTAHWLGGEKREIV